MLELSPFVTAMNAPASRIPASSRVSRSNTIPTRVWPSNPGGSRSKAFGFLSMIEMVWPWRARFTVSWLPTRPHPPMTTCMRARLQPCLPPANRQTRLVQMVGDAGDDDARLEDEGVLDAERRLVVQELVPPAPDDELGDDYRYDRVGRFRVELARILDQRPRHLAVGRVDRLERHVVDEVRPLIEDPHRLVVVDVERHRAKLGRAE